MKTQSAPRPASAEARPELGRFFLPGPTEVLPDVLAAQTGPMIGHRGPETDRLVIELQEGLKRAFRTERPVLIAPCSGTGMMEMAVRNGASRRVLSLVNGAFSARFAEIARNCGLEVDEVEVAWGEAHPPDMVRDALGRGRYDAVTVAHSETSTGVLNDVAAISEVVHEHPDTLLLVDSVSGAAGARLETDAWKLDFVLTGSQKAFAVPPGLGLAVASEAMVERARGIAHRGYYFDLVRYADAMAKNQVPTTPAVSTLYALQAQLRHMTAETMEARWERHRLMAERTWAWVGEMRGRGHALSILAPEGHRSPCVSVIVMPEGTSARPVVAAMKERGWVLGGGYGKLKEGTFRIGHMGEHTVEELDALLADLERVLD